MKMISLAEAMKLPPLSNDDMIEIEQTIARAVIESARDTGEADFDNRGFSIDEPDPDPDDDEDEEDGEDDEDTEEEDDEDLEDDESDEDDSEDEPTED